MTGGHVNGLTVHFADLLKRLRNFLAAAGVGRLRDVLSKESEEGMADPVDMTFATV